MRISVRVKPGSRRPGFERAADGVWVVRVAAPPVEGKANKAVCALIAEALGVAPSYVKVAGGETAKTKRIETPEIPDWEIRFEKFMNESKTNS